MLGNIVSRVEVLPREFTDHEVIAELKRTLTDRMEDTLGHEIQAFAEALSAEEPIQLDLWPETRKAQARHAGRMAVRMQLPRLRHNGHLHAAAALARRRFSTTDLRTVSTANLRVCYYEAKEVLDVFWARMTDYKVWELNGDTRQQLEQAAKETA